MEQEYDNLVNLDERYRFFIFPQGTANSLDELYELTDSDEVLISDTKFIFDVQKRERLDFDYTKGLSGNENE